LTAIAALALGFASAGCGRESCLGGDCEATTPCDRLGEVADCAAPTLFVGDLAAAPRPGRCRGAQRRARPGDVVLSNGVVTAVVSAIAAPTDLAPTGGNLIDLGPVGGADDLTIVYQLAGLLPDDAFAYDRLEVVDRAPAYVAVIARGHLDGRPEVEVATRYELRPCEPGLRVRSELHNGSPDRQAFVIADTAHWGKRRVLPFAPIAGQGYLAPELELLELTDLWRPAPYVAAATPVGRRPGLRRGRLRSRRGPRRQRPRGVGPRHAAVGGVAGPGAGLRALPGGDRRRHRWWRCGRRLGGRRRPSPSCSRRAPAWGGGVAPPRDHRPGRGRGAWPSAATCAARRS
jgi:hypothetical protein